MGKFEGTLESLQQRELPQWFDNAKFGIFIHWYPASVPAYAPLAEDLFTQTQKYGEETAFRESPYSEWYANSLAIEGSSVQKHHKEKYGNKPYDEFVTEFFEESQKWNPQEWQDLFVASGAKYCVMGTKHLDGAMMWPTEIHNPFKGEVYTSPRDIVGEACDAAKNAGMRVGLYYCAGTDITFQGLGYNGWMAMFLTTPQTDEYKKYANDQIWELIHRYSPDVLWNDVGWPGGSSAAMELMADYFNHNPEGVVNDRFDMIGVATGATHADFITPEYSSGLTLQNKKFEVCRGIGHSFGYNQMELDEHHASSLELIELLVNSVADGGNLLLNIGPKSDGTVPDVQRQRILDIGKWLSVNGEAIFDTQPHTVSTLQSTDGHVVRLTATTDGTTYAMILGDINSPTLSISGLPTGNVTPLAEGIAATREGDNVTLSQLPNNSSPLTLRIDR